MNLRCTFCQTPFTLGRLEKLAALQKMQGENLHHYDAHCPRCRRANSISRQKLEIFTPGWQDGLKTLEQDAARLEKEMATTAESFSAKNPVPSSEPAIVPVVKPVVMKVTQAAEKKPSPAAKPVAGKVMAAVQKKAEPSAKPKAESKSKPVAAAKKSAAKKPAAKKPAPKTKPKK